MYSFTGASISPDIKTVSVDFFSNKAGIVNPMLSPILTEKLRDRFNNTTTLNVIQSGGDLKFEGTIISYITTPTAIQGNETAALNRLTININAKFTNTKDEKLSYESNFSRFADYDSKQSLASVEEELIRKICDQLVDDMFNKAVVNW
jgi:hypothetical protein